MNQILILESQGQLCERLAREVALPFALHSIVGLEDAFQYAVRHSPAAIILDLEGDAQNRATLCERLRANALTQNIPLLVVDREANASVREMLYSKGVDDYLVQPVEGGELLLRLMARIRRFQEMKPRHHALGNMVLVPERHEVQVDGKSHHLSPLEFQLLRVFVANPNRSISRLELLNSIWGDVAVSNRTVDVHVSTLRRKLTNFNFSIDSIYGSGYILRETAPGRS
ncbi:MAG: response regulator transcription factor [Bdellovibrionales bacterium]